MSKDLEFSVGLDSKQYDAAIGKILSQAKGLAGAFLGFGSIAGALTLMTKEAIEAETVMSALTSSLRNAKNGSEEMLNSMSKSASDFSMKSKFSSEEVIAAYTKMTDTTGDAKIAFAAMGPAIEMATKRKMDLSQAANLVARSYLNGTQMLKKFGVQTKENLTGQEALNAVMDRFKGSMDAWGETTEGRVKTAQHAINELAQTAGKVFLPIIGDIADAIKDSLNYWTLWLDKILKVDKALSSAAVKEQQYIVDKMSLEWYESVQKYGTSDARTRAAERNMLNQKTKLNNLIEGANTPFVSDPAAAPEKRETKDNDLNPAVFQYFENLQMATDQTVLLMQTTQQFTSSAISGFANLGKAIGEGNYSKALTGFAMDGLSAFIDAIEMRIKALMALSLVEGNMSAFLVGGLEIAGLEALKAGMGTMFNKVGAANGVYGLDEPLITTLRPSEMIVPPSVSQGIAEGKLSLGGPGGTSGGEFHVHVHTDNLTNPQRVMKEQVLPAFKQIIVQHYGGKVARANGSPTF